MKKYKNKIILFISVLAVLLLTFWWGGNSPGLYGVKTENKTNLSDRTEKYSVFKNKDEDSSPENETEKDKESDLNDDEDAEANALNNAENTDTNVDLGYARERRYAEGEQVSNPTAETADTQSNDRAAEQEGQTAGSEEEQKNICTISVRCDSILDNLDFLNKSKRGLIPPDGVILNTTKAEFNDGENVFNVLQRELKRAKIHLEFTNTPIFDSVYIEGINNIYEFDCGENSGWMYSVNGEFPNFGCSKYILKAGDVIEWVYTCDLGKDVGGYYANTE